MLKFPEEKRRFIRLEIPIKISYTSKNDNQIHEAFSKDISAEGLRFLTNSSLKKDDELEIKLNINDAKNPVHVKGKVIWINESGSDKETFEVGIEFMEIEEDNKNTFLKFLCDVMYKQVKKISA